MNNRIYFDEHIEFLKSGYLRMNTRNLTRAFNEKFGMDKPESAIKTIIYKKKMRCGRKGNERLIEDRYTLLTKDQAEFVKDAYKKMPIPDVTSALNKHFGTEFGENQIEAYINNHGLKSGRTGQFKKGSKPWNTGTKGQGLTKANSGAFKKGNVPARTRPMFAERKNKDKLTEIKVPIPHPGKKTETQFMPKQRWIYEQHFGPIPPGYVVSFRDGNRENFSPDNLMLLSRAELIKLNQNNYREMPANLKPSVFALSKLQAQVSQKRKDITECLNTK